MNVVWEVNAVSLLAIVVQLVVGVAYVTRLHERAAAAEARSKQAMERVDLLQDQIRATLDVMATFKEFVASSYVRHEHLGNVETVLQRDITYIRERIDRLTEKYLPTKHP